MKIERVAQHFKAAGDLFACPKCQSPARCQGASFICAQGHCYDLSRRGYVNFAPEAGATKYTAELFDARREILEAGFYRPAAEAILRAVAETSPAPKLLDAGCGEGYYAGFLKQALPEAQVLAADLSKAAVMAAARHYSDILAMVADLARLPLRDASMDALINVLTPANYKEFFRVLKPGGRLVKVIPGEHYLEEIRSRLKGKLSRDSFSNAQVLAHIQAQTRVIHRETLHYTLPVTETQAARFLAMTPMTFNISDKKQVTPDFETITIHLELLVCLAPEG
ncbi:MAG: methyltransferase domain-containing protein [Eubacterium sp.]|nr:methyltransferase domain-containing protein [Eubacterium sp.]